MDTKVTLPFADGEYTFWLPMPRVVAAEREMARRDADGARNPHSIFAVFHNIGSHLGQIGDEPMLAGPSPALLKDAHSIILNGLIGGNSATVDGEAITVPDSIARDLLDTYCYPARPAILDLGLAWNILKAAIYGIDQGSKKKDGADSAPPPS